MKHFLVFLSFIVLLVVAVPLTAAAQTTILSNGSGGGDWASTSTWAGFVVPTFIDTVLIQGGDSVSVSADLSCHTLGLEAEAKLGLADTLVVEDFLGYGTVTANAGGRLRIDSSGTFGLDAVYVHARDGGSLPVATWAAGSTCSLTGLTGNSPSNGNQNFYHFIWNNPSQTANLNLGWTGITIGGNLTCAASGASSRFQMASNTQSPMTVTIAGDVVVTGGALTSNGSSGAATYAVTVQGDVIVTGGNLALSRGSGGVATWYLYRGFSISNATLQTSNSASKYVFSRPGTETITLTNVTYTSANNMEVASGTTVDFGTNILRGSGAFTLNAGAKLATGHSAGIDSTLKNTGTKTLNAGAGYIYNGSVAQVTGLTLPSVVGKLTINNALGVTLSDTVRVDSTLTFTTGNITTGANVLEVGTDGQVLRTSGHVNGLMKKTMILGADAKTFEIGDATAYAPVTVSGASYAGNFTIAAATTAADHGSIGSSGLDASKSVNRSWTLNGTPTGSSDITLNFNPADLDAGINPQNLKVGKYDGSWSLPTVGTKTSTSTQATGISSLSDFIVAQVVPLTILSNGTGGGVWASASTWQGGVVPSTLDSAIILTGDSVGVAADAGAWYLEMQSGSKVGLSDTLAAAYFLGNGTLTANAASRFRVDSSGTFANGSVYNHALNGGSLPTAAWAAGSTCMLTGITANSPANANQNFHHFIWNNPSQSANLNLAWTGITIGGDLTCAASGASSRFQMASNTQSPMTVTIAGDVIVTGGALTSNGSSGAGTYAVTVQGDVVVTGGNLALSRGSGGVATWYLYGGFSVSNATLQTSNSASKYVFSGNVPQVVTLSNVTFTSANNMEVASGSTTNFGTSQLRGTGAFTLNANGTLMTGHFGGLDSTLLNTGTKTLNAAAGYIFNGSVPQATGVTLPAVVGDLTFDNAGGVALSDTVRADSSLSLVSGVVATGVNLLEVGPNGSSSRASGHVNGHLVKTMATGADSKTFEIGDASLYTPVDVSGASYAGAFTINALTTAGDHGSIGSSGLDAGRSANRVYTLTGTPTGSSDITFHFDPSDVDAGANPTGFKVGKYDGAWTLPAVGTATSTSTQATGIASLSDFILAQLPPALVLSNGTGGGDWTATSTWQGGVVPVSVDSVIILGGDSVWVPAGGASASGVQVAFPGILALVDTLSATYSSVSGTVVSHIGGRFSVDSGAVFGNGSVYQHNQNGGSLPIATWNTGSTLLLTGIAGNSPSNGNQNFHHVIWNNPAQSANLNLGWNNITIGGNITVIASGASSRWQMCGPVTDSSATVTIMGDVLVSGGGFTTNGTSNGNTTITVNHYGNVNVTGGNFSISRGSQGGTGTARWYLHNGDFTMANATTQNSNAAGARFVFTKSGAQALTLTNVTFGGGGMPSIVEAGTRLNAGTSMIRGSGAFTLQAGATIECANTGGLDSTLAGTGTVLLDTLASYVFDGATAQVTGVRLPAKTFNLTFDNPGGVTMTGNVVVAGTLNLASGIVSAGANTIEVASGGSTSRTTGHVNGVLRKHVGPGVDNETFEIGDASQYAPVDVAGASYASEFPLDAVTTAGDHASIGSSVLDAARSVNRTWNFNGTATGSSNVTFHFPAGEVDGPANTNNFLVGRYDGSWTYPAVGVKTATSTQATGVAGFSGFQIAEQVGVTLHAIIATAGPNGTIFPADTLIVNDSVDQAFTFTPSVGYHVDSVFVDGGYVDSTAGFTFYTVTADHTIHVTFAINTYALNVTVNGDGAVAKDPDQVVYAHGTSVELTATPELGWDFSGWTGDVVSATNPLDVTMDGAKNITATFTQDSSYFATYRSFTPAAYALDIDMKGKLGKYEKRKPWRVDFSVYFVVDSMDVNDFHIEFGLAVDTAFPLTSTPAGTFSNPDGKFKKWDLAFGDSLNAGDTVVISGFGKAGKPQKIMKYWWTRNGVLVGKKVKGGVFTLNQPKYPMPNRNNVAYEAFGTGGFIPTGGLTVGVPRLDSAKQYGWLQIQKHDAVYKTLNYKGFLQTAQPRGFDYWLKNNKPLVKLQKYLQPHKYNNALMAELVTLKLGITASMLGITPPGFGELILDGDSVESSPWQGYTVAEIAAEADTLMMGWYDSAGVRGWADTATYDAMYDAVSRINAAFEGPVDTVDGGFTGFLSLTGTRSILEVAHTLRPNDGVVPARIEPLAMAGFEAEPESYSLRQNYPNPFNPTTTIEFELLQSAVVSLKVYNLLGQEVANLIDREELSDGLQDVEFDATNLPSGVYIYRLVADGVADEYDDAAPQSFVSVKKMVLVK